MSTITRTMALFCLVCCASGGPDLVDHPTAAEVLASLLLSADQLDAFNPSNLAGSRPASGVLRPTISASRPLTASRPTTVMADEAEAPAEPASARGKIALADLKEGDAFTGKVTSVAVFGLFVDFGAETDGLLHLSEISEDRLPNGELEKMFSEGDSVSVTIKEVSDGKVGLATPEKMKSSIMKLEDLEVGMDLEGTVKSTVSFGAFVDIGAVADGLLHVSELNTGDGFIDDPSKVVSPGDKIKCYIKSLNVDEKQIGLGNRDKAEQDDDGDGFRRRAPPSVPKEKYEKYEQMDPTEFITGNVKTILSYGAFVTLEQGIDALLHITELGSDEYIEDMNDQFSEGDEVSVRIKSVDAQNGKISVSMKDYVESEGRDVQEDTGPSEEDILGFKPPTYDVETNPEGVEFLTVYEADGKNPLVQAFVDMDATFKSVAQRKKPQSAMMDRLHLKANSRRRARILPENKVSKEEAEEEEEAEEKDETEKEPVEEEVLAA